MWPPTLNFSTILSNASKGFTETIATVNSLLTSAPPAPQVETPKREIPVATNKTPSFQCQRSADPRNGRALEGDRRGRRSHNAFTTPPVIFPHSRGSENRTTAQQERTKDMQDEMRRHIASKRGMGSIHPAGLRPITNSPKQNQPQPPLTGQGARNLVLRNGIRPTNFKSGDATKAKEQNLETIGKKLAKLEFELSQNNIRKGNLNKVNHHPEFGSHNSRRTEGYRDEGLNIQKNIDTLNTSLLKNCGLDDIKKVYASRNKELQRLKSTPSLSPSAPLVAEQTSRGHLTRK